MRNLLWLVAMLALPLSASAQAPCLDWTDLPGLTGSAWMGGDGQDLAIVGDVAVVALYGDGIAVMDIADPAAPRQLALLPLGYSCRSVEASGDVAFVGTGGGGIFSIDVSDPTLPIVLDHYELSAWTLGMHLVGDTLYTTDWGSGGVTIFDVGDPSSLARVGAVKFGGNTDGIAVVGRHAFVSGEDHSSLFVVDVGNPARPVVVAQAQPEDLNGWDHGKLVVANGHAVIGIHEKLNIFDIGDPLDPAWVTEWDPPGRVLGLEALGEQVFVGGDNGNLLVLDLSIPSSPTLIGHIPSQFEMNGLCAAGGFVYACQDDRFAVTDPSVLPVSSPVIGSLSDAYGYADVDMDGDVAYAGTSASTLKTVDISDPTAPRVLGGVRIDDPIVEVEHEDGYAFARTSRGGISVIDVSVRTYLREVATIAADASFVSMDVVGDLLVAAAALDGIRVFDVSAPEDPQLLASMPSFDTNTFTARIHGSFLLAGDRSGLVIHDLSDPAQPTFLSNLEFGTALQLHVDQDVAYVVGEGTGLFVIDITDLANPQLLGQAPVVGTVTDVKSSRGFVYLGTGTDGILLYDATDPASPRFVATMEPLEVRMGGKIDLQDGFLAVGSYPGFTIVPVHLADGCPTGTGQLPLLPRGTSVFVSPNPFTPSTTIHLGTSVTGPAQIGIYDARGRCVRILARQWVRAGSSEFSWDGRDDRGRSVASGPYFLRAETGAGVAVTKLTILK